MIIVVNREKIVNDIKENKVVKKVIDDDYSGDDDFQIKPKRKLFK